MGRKNFWLKSGNFGTRRMDFTISKNRCTQTIHTFLEIRRAFRMESKLYLESTQLWILENIMKSSSFIKRTASVFSAILVLFLSFNLMSCKTAEDSRNDIIQTEKLSSDSILIGKWTSSYSEIFEISETELKNFYKTSEVYQGNSLLIAKTSSDSGYIYIKYTKAMNTKDVGKWYAIVFKDLTSNSVKISAAYKAGGKTSTVTLEEAINEFTIENGYFGTFSECTK